MCSRFLAKFLVFIYIFINVYCDDDLKLVTRLPKNPLMRYNSYADVMILHFKVPEDTINAVFLFKVKDTPTSFLRKYTQMITNYSKKQS